MSQPDRVDLEQRHMADHDFIPCTVPLLDAEAQIRAAEIAVEVNPANRPNLESLSRMVPDFELTPGRLAIVTTKYWGAKGIKLTTAFVDSPPADLQKRILVHLNAWAKHGNVEFVPSGTDPMVRIAREASGYWSYLGTDILAIPRNQQTMNLQGFTMQTSEAEFVRVVRHEAGHTLGFPHEHMREELVAKLDAAKTITYFMRTQGWTEQEVRQQVLTPLSQSSIMGTPNADATSIMCYQLPGSITKDGQPIPGGGDINQFDAAFTAKMYPKQLEPEEPEKPVCPTVCDWLGGLQRNIGDFRRQMRKEGLMLTTTEQDKANALGDACKNLNLGEWVKILNQILTACGNQPPTAVPLPGWAPCAILSMLPQVCAVVQEARKIFCPS